MNNRCVSQFSLPLSPAQQHSLDGDREHREGVGGGGGVGGRGEDGGRGGERERKRGGGLQSAGRRGRLKELLLLLIV